MYTGVDWRQKLETQRGAVLATELKNNANKLAKWTAAAHISGSDMMKLGYVTRATPRDTQRHAILGTQVNRQWLYSEKSSLIYRLHCYVGFAKMRQWYIIATHNQSLSFVCLGDFPSFPRRNQSTLIDCFEGKYHLQVCKPKDFAAQINLSMENAWGIVRALVDLCVKLDEGKYLLLKDPNKQLLRLYEVASDAFETNYSEEPVANDEEEAPVEEPAAAKLDEDDED